MFWVGVSRDERIGLEGFGAECVYGHGSSGGRSSPVCHARSFPRHVLVEAAL